MRLAWYLVICKGAECVRLEQVLEAALDMETRMVA